jgi:hypothetical protein
MYRPGAVAGGVIAGAIGAAVWAGIAYFTGYEVGWVAWAVGGLVGFGVVLGNSGERSQQAGVLAVVVTVLALLAAKYTTVQLILSNDSEIMSALVSGLEDDELVISYLADDVVVEFMSEDKPVNWPVGVDPSQASTEVEYPTDVWAVAQSQWDEWSVAEREEYRSDLEEMVSANIAVAMEDIRSEMAQIGFMGSFGLLDIIFFGLAVVTAYKVAATAQTTVVAEAPEEALEEPADRSEVSAA